MKRLVLLALAVVLLAGVAPAGAAAESCPPFDGGQSFPKIEGPEGPEEYCWEVRLHEEQELRQIDDRHAAVFWDSEHVAFGIEAGPAHDADGTAVPTTIAVSGANLITLTVHHRAGNSAAGGAPFQYPIIAGVGWEGGFQFTPVEGPPAESMNSTPPPAVSGPTPLCEVPSLRGKTVRGARRARGVRVVKQYQPSGELLPAGTVVGIKLG